jgi:hypothetical protein
MTPQKRPKDKLAEIIGEIGRWQLQNIFIVFLVGIPGLAHIYSSVFVAAKSDFWCSDDVVEGIDPLLSNISRNKDSCRQNCSGGYA